MKEATRTTATPHTARGRFPSPGMHTDKKYTGQTEDKVSGLYWYGSRYYDANLGRFVQPDTIVPAPTNPQTLNRYAYALNNPVRFSDPSGHYTYDPGAYDDQYGSGGSGYTYEQTGDTDSGYTAGGNYGTTYPAGDPGSPDSGAATGDAGSDPFAEYEQFPRQPVDPGSPESGAAQPEAAGQPTPSTSPIPEGSPGGAASDVGTGSPGNVGEAGGRSSPTAPSVHDVPSAILGATGTALDNITFPAGTATVLGNGARLGVRSLLAVPGVAYDGLSTYSQELAEGYGSGDAALLGASAAAGGLVAGVAVAALLPASVPLVAVVVVVGGVSLAGSKIAPEVTRSLVVGPPPTRR